jgi:hypothetical protein
MLTCGLDSAWLGQFPKVASFEYSYNTDFIPAQSNGYHLRKNDRSMELASCFNTKVKMFMVLSTALLHTHTTFSDTTHALHTCDKFLWVQQTSQAKIQSHCLFQHWVIFAGGMLSLNYKEYNKVLYF